MSRASNVEIINDIAFWANTDKNGAGTPYIPVVDSDGHLQVDIVSGGGGGEQYADGTAVDAGYKGNLVLGTDGSHYQILAVDSLGNLKVRLVDPSGDEPEWADMTNNAIRVNVVAGGAGGGVAQTQVRDASNNWVDVGYYSGNLNMPVQIESSLPAGTNNIGKVDINAVTPDLMLGTDFSNVFGTESLISATPAVKVEEQGTVTVQATAFDIRNLSSATDSVTIEGGNTTDVKVTLAGEAVVLGSPADGTYIGDIKFGESLPSGTNVIGKVDINSQPTPSTVYSGQKTVATAGTAEALAASTTVKSVVIKALYSNTGTVYVGDSSVSSTTGIELAAGDSVALEIDDLSKIYLDVSVSGEGVSYIATN